MNILGWTIMLAIGMNAAVSVRISNELGANHPRTARLSLVVSTVCLSIFGVFFSPILVTALDVYPSLCSEDDQVQELVNQLTPLLAASIVINSIHPVLSGLAVGAGWQGVVACVNVGCYYAFGIPLGILLGYTAGWGVVGIWYGMLGGIVAQTVILFLMIYRTNWTKEASVAEARIRKWGGGEYTDTIKNNKGTNTIIIY